ncbi:MAG TPA: aspartyl protease family protein [Chthoniobacterales bacterium]|nr:aspartyl protease family protein [Chthoniobacterales bacterium]
MNSKFSTPPWLRALLAIQMVCLVAPIAKARIDLSILQQQGYGMVELKRPHPNTLTLKATINGQSAVLIVDTGWSGHGITVDSESAGSLKMPLTDDPGRRQSLSGKHLTGFKKGVANTVSLGNVQMHNVPVLVGYISGLHAASVRREIGATGFLSAGFLRTCSAVIDLHNLRLYLRPPGTGHRTVLGPAMRGAGLAEIPFTITGNALALVDAEINGASGAMIVDTGKTLTGVDTRFASKIKVVGHSSRVGTLDAAGAIIRTELAKIQSFKIGGVRLRAPDVRLEKFPLYTQTSGRVIGLLGIDILGPNGAIIDFGNLKLYCYPL